MCVCVRACVTKMQYGAGSRNCASTVPYLCYQNSNEEFPETTGEQPVQHGVHSFRACTSEKAIIYCRIMWCLYIWYRAVITSTGKLKLRLHLAGTAHNLLKALLWSRTCSLYWYIPGTQSTKRHQFPTSIGSTMSVLSPPGVLSPVHHVVTALSK